MVYLQKRKKLLKRVFIFFILSAAVCLLVAIFDLILNFGFRDSISNHPMALVLFSVLAATLLYKPSELGVLSLFQNLLFKHRMDRVQNLMHASRVFLHTLDLKELSNLIVNTVSDLMGQRVAILVLSDKSKQKLSVASSTGVPVQHTKKIKFEEASSIIAVLKERQGLIEREKLVREYSWPEVYEITKGFEVYGAAAFLPLVFEHQWFGFLSLSGKKGGEPFSYDEIRALEDFAQTASLALRNAVLVDDLKQANDKLKDYQSRLLQTTKLAAIEQLAAGIAHEIHNPLTIISGRAQIMLLNKNKAVDDEALAEALKTIVKQTKRAADITRKLLMFSEPKTSGQDLIDFSGIIDDTLALISYQMTLDEIAVLKNVSKNLPVFRGEINEIREIFLNLILNAVQAVDKKGTIQIDVFYVEKDGVIEIRIRDDGPGISSEHLSRVFDPFYSTRDGAVGLGLFITQQIVNRYRGSIHVESEAGRGTIVVIQFPEKVNRLGQPTQEEISDSTVTK